MASIDFKRLSRRVGYVFRDEGLAQRALTHCSMGQDNNERLEFLGDSILSFVIANALFQRFPYESEGQLSRLRSFLVKGDTLAEIAMELDLGDFLRLGQGELKSGGFRRASILADALEALLAAIYLDGGIEVCIQVILTIYRERLEDDVLKDTLKDAKTQLQEYLQAQKKQLPTYSLLKIDGEEHEQLFHVQCKIKNPPYATQGVGQSRRRAEQEAALQLLKLLMKD